MHDVTRRNSHGLSGTSRHTIDPRSVSATQVLDVGSIRSQRHCGMLPRDGRVVDPDTTVGPATDDESITRVESNGTELRSFKLREFKGEIRSAARRRHGAMVPDALRGLSRTGTRPFRA